MGLSVNEIFSSIQGEGIHTGFTTTFIRLAGCNLDCKWCDTKYALKITDGDELQISDIIHKVNTLGMELVCLTGGEPLFQKGSIDLVRDLLQDGLRVDIETNGSLDISEFVKLGSNVMISIDVKPPSSGEENMFLRANLQCLRPIDQIKFIISDKEDLAFAIGFIEKNSLNSNIILTPVNNEGGVLIVDELIERIRTKDLSSSIRVMVQTHKVIWDADKRGV